MKTNTLLIILSAMILNGCAWFGFNNEKASRKLSPPTTKLIQKPGGDTNNWRYLGTSEDGVLVDEIDINSISLIPTIKNNSNYTYQDRKTIVLTNEFNYPNNQPRFKYLISNWQINCTTHEYLLNSTTLYNDAAIKLISYNYSNLNNAKWLTIGTQSFAAMQYDFICLNQNKNLGY